MPSASRGLLASGAESEEMLAIRHLYERIRTLGAG
jgi:hypothetical protein